MKKSACALALVCIFLAGCQKKELLPRPEFPLSEAALTAALEETGLPWSIEQADELTNGTGTSIVYTLHRPETRAGYNGVFITSYETETHGRTLAIDFREPQNKQWWQEETIACWEDWRETLVLAARLYGGFEDAEEIYRACSAVELPKEDKVLWEGTLTGGYYFRMVTENPLQPERFSMGNFVFLDIYESEDAYLQFVAMAQSIYPVDKTAALAYNEYKYKPVCFRARCNSSLAV